MRLQKFMSYCGVASRRKCEAMILSGRVRVNNRVVTQMGLKVDPSIDTIQLDGKILTLEKKKIYILLNKPRGYVTTVNDPQGRPTVMDLIGKQQYRLYPVGRLDFDTEGLLILTNDGELAFKLTHPRHQTEKQYYVVVTGNPDPMKLDQLRGGISLGSFKTSPATIIQQKIHEGNAAFIVKIREGKNRQIRRMFDAIGHPVKFLRREKIGNISIDNLGLGEWRHLSIDEINALYSGD